VYGKFLRIPSELLTPSTNPVDPVLLITELRQHMARLRPVPAARHTSPAAFMHSNLEKCTHVFLHQDATRRALEPPCSGPCQVLSRRDKMLQLLIWGRPITMSADRIMPAYILHQNNRANTNSPAPATSAIAPLATPLQPSTKPMCSGHHIHFPSRFKKHLSDHLRRGVMWEPPTVPNRWSQLLQC
jgi:hypothetical protein